MTEDDTFRVLARRIPFYDMMKLYRSGIGPTWPNNQDGEWEIFFDKYGWNWEEFSKEWKDWNGGVGTYSDFEKSKK